MQTTNPTSHSAFHVLDAFRLYDQEGLPLAVSISAAQDAGLRVNLTAFACDAFAAGWTDEKLRSVLEAACCDTEREFKWVDFEKKLAQLYTLSGGGDAPDCFRRMKDRLCAL